VKFEILSNPEFLAEGTAIKDLLSPDRVIIGSADTASGRRAAAILTDVYAAWIPRSRITTINVWSSELSKLVANAMLAQRISSINSISAICEKTGANIEEIALSVGLDPRIGPQYLKSSLGFGGSCFKKDILSLIYLAQSLGLHKIGEYWQQVLTLNDFQRSRFARRVITRLNNTIVHKKITLLGYAFKKNTSDTRESPAVDVIKILLNDGPAEIAIFDPCCNPEAVKVEIQRLLGGADDRLLKSEGGPVEVYNDAYSACRDSNAIVILTEWDEFRNLPISISNKLSPKDVKAIPGPKTTKRKIHLPDPRPFQTLEPSESDLLALHRYLSSQPQTPRLTITATAILTPPSTPNPEPSIDMSNPLNRYAPEPACPETCPECARESGAYSKAGEQLDWVRVAASLKSPKWVFDGRGIIDVPEMSKLGVRVEAIGKPSLFGREGR
jgi:UDPglucose 6-dehydrogenase